MARWPSNYTTDEEEEDAMKPLKSSRLCAATKALKRALLLALAIQMKVLEEWRSTNEDCAAWPTGEAVEGAALAEKDCQGTEKRISSPLISCYRVASSTSGDPRPMVRGKVYASWHEAAIHQLEILTVLCVQAVSAEAGCRVRLHELECLRLEIDFVDLDRECAQAVHYVSNLPKLPPHPAAIDRSSEKKETNTRQAIPRKGHEKKMEALRRGVHKAIEEHYEECQGDHGAISARNVYEVIASPKNMLWPANYTKPSNPDRWVRDIRTILKEPESQRLIKNMQTS